jgi:nucleoside-diphosphate-sugar epimerase
MFEYFRVDKADFSGPVLVTGAGGCIGSWALALLGRAGVSTVAFDLTEEKRRPRLLMSEAQLAKVKWLTGDIADADTVMRTVEQSKASAIIHLAALQVPFCKADPIGGAKVNVVGTVNVFEAARKLGIKRVAYASSSAAHGVLPDSPWTATLYGAYKLGNEHTAKVYFQDWAVPSVGMRPGVVYGVARDQGMSSKTTAAILAAAAGKPYTVPFRGAVSWLHAGEVASAFIRAVSKERNEAKVFEINGVGSTVEHALEVLGKLAPGAQVSCSGDVLRFPMDLSDAPLRAYLGDYGSVLLDEGIRKTFEAFRSLLASGQLKADAQL